MSNVVASNEEYVEKNIKQGEFVWTENVNDRVVLSLVCNGDSGDKALEEKVAKVMGEYFLLWQQKQRSYGPKNIGDFGAAGCNIRANDKIQRLRRHYFMGKDVSLDTETIEDTWKDLMGYALMGLICERGQWPD